MAGAERAAALGGRHRRAAAELRDIAPDFERSDVCAQLLRARVYADWAGVAPWTGTRRGWRRRGGGFQFEHTDPRIRDGFWFGRKGAVSSVRQSGLDGVRAQALDMWWQYWKAGAPPGTS